MANDTTFKQCYMPLTETQKVKSTYAYEDRNKDEKSICIFLTKNVCCLFIFIYLY